MIPETPETLASMGVAEGSAAAHGLATLVHHLLKAQVITDKQAAAIRDQMLIGLDPSISDPDCGLHWAYHNTLLAFDFVAIEPPPLMEPDSIGAAAFRKMRAGFSNT